MKKELACDTSYHSPCVSEFSSSSPSNLPPVRNDDEISKTFYDCNVCKAQFLSEDLLVQHVNDLPCATNHSHSALEFRYGSSQNLPQVSSVDKRSRSSDKPPVTIVDEVTITCYDCNVCKARFLSEDLLVQHVNDFPCAPLHNQCAPEIRCRSSPDKVSNVDEASDPCSYVCDICEAQFFSGDLLAQHASKHTNDPQAEAKFDSTNSLRVHPSKHKTRKQFECPFCGKKFNVQYLMKEHMRVHTGEKPYECETCGKKFSHRTALRNHSERHHDDNSVEDGAEEDHARYKCPKCDEKFPAMPRLKNHLLVQHNVKCSCTCTSCNSVFVSTSQLKKHNRTCVPENPVTCNVCEAKFSNKRLLQKHLSKHRAGKRFECGVCGKKFPFEYLLREHLPKHTGEKAFECEQCNKNFAYRASLRAHKRQVHGDNSAANNSVEEEVEDHKCDICDKTFRKKHLLQVHLWKHRAKEEKRFKCPVCSKSFNYNYEMVRHLGGHAEENPIVA